MEGKFIVGIGKPKRYFIAAPSRGTDQAPGSVELKCRGFSSVQLEAVGPRATFSDA